MKKQRQTIPLSKWKVAVHLEATRHIQNQKGNPAYRCKCEWCINWKLHCKDILPEELQVQLNRVGVELGNPTDLYKYDEDESGSYIRIVYHVVGNILNGPNTWVNNDMSEVLMYQTIRKSPYLSIILFSQKQYHGYAPTVEEPVAGNLQRIDFRLLIPKNHVPKYA